jgi:hypothetical protein
MNIHPASLTEPTTTTVPRRPGSIRRTSHIDMVFEGPLVGGPLRLRGGARDLLTTPGGDARVLDEAQVDADLDETRRLRALTTHPEAPATQALVGVPVGRGFRGALAEVYHGTDDGSPLYLLLDDLPVAALISGYASMYDTTPLAVAASVESKPSAARMLQADICSGWRSDGTMMVSLASGKGLPVPVGPPAPRLEPEDDPSGWHHIADLGPNSMRRRRLVDVTWGDPLVVSAMFRDTHRSGDGEETVLHEYTVDATVDPETLVVRRCEATPRSLPWDECPLAAASAERLTGQRAGDLRSFVRSDLTGITTCTHLNDLLRSLAAVAALAPALAKHVA